MSYTPPSTRLGMTLGLGLLGAFLMRAEQDFSPNMFGGIRNLNLFAWLLVAFLGVRLVYRTEKACLPGALFFLMAAALVLSLLIPKSPGRPYQWGGSIEGVVFCCFFSILMLLILGASFLRCRDRYGTGWLPWLKALAYGPVVFLTAPLLLFALRPAVNRAASPPQRLIAGTHEYYLHIFAFGFSLHFVLLWVGEGALATGLGFWLLSFTFWSCVGCGLLFVLSPWPEHLLVFPPSPPVPLGRKRRCILVVLTVLALAHLPVLKAYPFVILFFHPLFILGSIGCMVTALLIPWPTNRFFPKVAAFPESHQSGALSTAVFLTMGLVVLGTIAFGPWSSIVSGQLFTEYYDDTNIGGGLDQPSIGKWYFLFCYFSALVIPYVAIARWMRHRNTLWGYLAFFLPVLALGICLLGIWMVPFAWMLQIILRAPAFTLAHFYGMEYGLMAFACVAAFLGWAVWPPKFGRQSCIQENDSVPM